MLSGIPGLAAIVWACVCMGWQISRSVGSAYVEQSASCLRQLADRTGLTAHLAILVKGEAILIERITPVDTPGARVATWAGKRMGLHCTALGKVLVAHVAESEMEQMVKRQGFLRHNENTIASMAKLKDQCANIRHIGYSIDDEEEEIGVRCVGVPVKDGREKVVAAVSLTGTTDQLNEISSFATLLKRTALDISGVLASARPDIESEGMLELAAAGLFFRARRISRKHRLEKLLPTDPRGCGSPGLPSLTPSAKPRKRG